VDALRPAAAGDVLEQLQPPGRDRVRSPNRYWNSSITATIRGHVPLRSAARSSSSLVTSWALAASARRRISSARCCNSASPNSRSVLMLTPISARAAARRSAAGRELGERHALLEVEQVELQLVRE
jgi:hypothetical protein